MKTKSEKLHKRAWSFLRDPRREKLVLTVALCLSLFTAALILTPLLGSFLSIARERSSAATAQSTEPSDELSTLENIEESSVNAHAAEKLTAAPPSMEEELPAVFSSTEPEGEEDSSGWWTKDGKTYYYDEQGEPLRGLQKIDGKLYYFDVSGVKARSVGIDVSYYDCDIDWPALKAQGLDFVIIRTGGRTWQSGELYDDYRTTQYLEGAKSAGLKVGVYFYSTAINEAEAVQEAEWTLQSIDGATLDLPVFIDVEKSGMYPRARSDKLSAAERSAVIRAFCETVESSGYAAGVYSGQYYMQYNLDYSVFSQYTIWLASYTANNKLPAFYERYDIWQFTDTARIDGLPGYADMNVIF